MKYEKDFFMKINCHANEWRETLRLEGSKRNGEYFTIRWIITSIYISKNCSKIVIIEKFWQVVLLINSNTFLHYSKTQQWNIKKPSVYFYILWFNYLINIFFSIYYLTKQIWRCIHWHTLFVIFNKLNL